MAVTPASRAEFKRRLLGGNPMVAPFVWDPLTAQLAELAGSEVVYLSGAATAASRGYPDIGLLTQSEMAGIAGSIVRHVSVPVVADADEGFGSALNVMRTVDEYEAAGVCALHLEDQVSPKRPNNRVAEVVTVPSMLIKLKAALHARTDPDFLVIARTDSLQSLGLDDALARARAYFDAGCDLVFVTGLAGQSHLCRYAHDLAGVPKVHVSNPPLTRAELSDYGICLELHNGTFLPTWSAFLAAAISLLEPKTHPDVSDMRAALARASGLGRYESSLAHLG